MCKTFNIKSEGFPSTHFCCSIFYVNNFGVASVLILSYLTSLLWWASLKAVVLMDWTHHNHDQTHQHHSHCFDQHRHQKLTRYRLGGKVGALSHRGRSDICGCGNNFIFHSVFFFKKLRLGLALALTLEFIYMLGMKLSGDIAVVLDDNLQLLAIDRLLF